MLDFCCCFGVVSLNCCCCILVVFCVVFMMFHNSLNDGVNRAWVDLGYQIASDLIFNKVNTRRTLRTRHHHPNRNYVCATDFPICWNQYQTDKITPDIGLIYLRRGTTILTPRGALIAQHRQAKTSAECLDAYLPMVHRYLRQRVAFLTPRGSNCL